MSSTIKNKDIKRLCLKTKYGKTEELWFRYIEKFDRSYGITINGIVISFKRSIPKILTTRLCNWGYYKGLYIVTLWDNKVYSVADLIAHTYIPNPEQYERVRFIDGDTSNLNISNLEWCGDSRKNVTDSRIICLVS